MTVSVQKRFEAALGCLSNLKIDRHTCLAVAVRLQHAQYPACFRVYQKAYARISQSCREAKSMCCMPYIW